MPSFLLECFSEEIPSRMQRAAGDQLVRAFTDALNKAGITHGTITPFVSPRHLALHIEGLPALQPDRTEEKKGPKTTAPEAALAGFAQSAGVDLATCETRTIGKDDYYFATTTIKGRKVANAITDISNSILAGFTWPKSMRWGGHAAVWVRPLHRIVALFDDAVLPVKFHHITASNVTLGHRFLSPDAITVTHADSYVAQLEEAMVLVDFAKRKEIIRAQIHAAAKTKNLTPVDDEDLLNEITGLIEWPTTYIGTFDESFLRLPPEVLISEMKHHQRYVALNAANGTLSNHFIVVSNMRHADAGAVVVEGNARVLRARLSDGAFYFESDQAKPLESWAEGLRDVVFHAKVGMMHEKVARIETLALQIAAAVNYAKDKAIIMRAATLCKADLTSGMVGEFPDLQGIMGRYYAKAQGEHTNVCEAIYEHYKPQGAGDGLPETDEGAIISLADKLDSIISLWAAGEKPTGSKDPLALRRAAIGVLRILDARGWHVDLQQFFPKQAGELADFFADRMRQMLKEEGIRHDIIEAVLAALPQGFVPTTLFTRARDFAGWLKTEAGEKTTAAIKRALNILSAEEKKDKTRYSPRVHEKATHSSEQELMNALDASMTKMVSFDQLDRLSLPINSYFDAVLITEEEHKTKRLSLLSYIRQTSEMLADFSRLEG